MSETAAVRHMAMQYIPEKSNGLDLGFGGDPICPTAIAVDLPKKYTTVGNNSPQHLYGDATNLHWFRDGVMDYVYSSHLLEDFVNTKQVLVEWLRVLKPEGHLILCLPNELRYRAHCKATGQGYNMAHKCEAMSIEYIEGIFKELNVDTVFKWQAVHYSFLIVGRKRKFQG